MATQLTLVIRLHRSFVPWWGTWWGMFLCHPRRRVGQDQADGLEQADVPEEHKDWEHTEERLCHCQITGSHKLAVHIPASSGDSLKIY